MDINSLLSPQTSSAGDRAPGRGGSRPVRKSAGPSSTAKASASPRLASAPSAPSSSAPQGHLSAAPRTGPSPPLPNAGDGRSHSIKSTPPTDGRAGSGRQPSTPGMDTLADLATMQHHQQAARLHANGLRNNDVYDAHQHVTPPAHPLPQTRPRTHSTPRSSVELAMSDAGHQTPPPRSYASTAFDPRDVEQLKELDAHLAQDPFAFSSHLDLIALLRRYFLRMTQGDLSLPNPQADELLHDLRQVREAMDARFPLGESRWIDWITDEGMAVTSIDDRVAVMELCQRAVEEEVASPTLWALSGEFVLGLYCASHPDTPASLRPDDRWAKATGWTDEERTLGREIFGWETVIDLFSRAAHATAWHIADSHLVWDRYLALLTHDLTQDRSQPKILLLRRLFFERLQTPHATWDTTFQSFSTFITTWDNAAYESTMVDANTSAAEVKALYAAREGLEARLQAAKADSPDAASPTEFGLWLEYLDWEVSQLSKKKGGSRALCNALYERATLRLETNARLWEDYVFFAVDQAGVESNAAPILPILQRATRHCPWSGTLWSQYLLTLEREQQPFHEIEEVKHRATSTGLMDIGGMEEVLKVYSAWCGYLNRRAFDAGATDEEADVAEVGIRSALESVKELGEKKYGAAYHGDPTYRLERIYIEYLSHSGGWARARQEVWRALIPSRGDSYEFWLQWFQWEMVYWNRMSAVARTNGATSSKRAPTPSEATAVLRQALRRKSLDWPEKIIQIYLAHVEDHEHVEEIQRAVIHARRISMGVAKRREREAIVAAEAAAAQQLPPAAEAQEASSGIVGGESPSGTKRKREVDADAEDVNTTKKARGQDETPPASVGSGAISEASARKRDRENATIIVRNLPRDVPKVKVRQFFRDCGTINSLNLTPEDGGESTTAWIEFESKDDVATAQTRALQPFEERPIEIQPGTGSTLFVTNFPPTADESYIRNLFKDYEIVDVRFPSLKYNTHRRFCYVQFKSSYQADQASQLDGMVLGGKLKLVAKISDPSHKQDRSGALYEGREIYVSNVDWSATEDEIRQIFEKYGTVERIRIPTNMAGKSKGVAFVVFSSKDEATAALDMHLTKFKSRVVNVEMSVTNPAKRTTTSIIKPRTSASPVPDEVGKTDRKEAEIHPSRESIQARTITLLNIPDTINDARIRTLMEPYGAVTKITLRHDHRGAIVEFADASDAGKASLAVDGHEIAPGRTISVGTVRDMLSQKAEMKIDRIQVGAGAKRGGEGGEKPAVAMQTPGPIRRPNPAGSGAPRRGGKGGLGTKDALNVENSIQQGDKID
ncbi:MAG: Splicing factor [Thelocarpon superellum]|nr:MAG: Splicing factor [Thelocarpon superellum]